jgi:hypothetical protein
VVSLARHACAWSHGHAWVGGCSGWEVICDLVAAAPVASMFACAAAAAAAACAALSHSCHSGRDVLGSTALGACVLRIHGKNHTTMHCPCNDCTANERPQVTHLYMPVQLAASFGLRKSSTSRVCCQPECPTCAHSRWAPCNNLPAALYCMTTCKHAGCTGGRVFDHRGNSNTQHLWQTASCYVEQRCLPHPIASTICCNHSSSDIWSEGSAA